MATVTREIGRVTDDTNASVAILSIDYDDVALRLTAVHLDNPTTMDVYVTARRANGTGQTYTVNVPPGGHVDQVVPGNAAARIGITVDANGRVDGVAYSFGFGSA